MTPCRGHYVPVAFGAQLAPTCIDCTRRKPGGEPVGVVEDGECVNKTGESK